MNDGIRSPPPPDGSSYACGAQVSYSCDSGFELIGQATLACGSDGDFDFPKPECREIGA